MPTTIRTPPRTERGTVTSLHRPSPPLVVVALALASACSGEPPRTSPEPAPSSPAPAVETATKDAPPPTTKPTEPVTPKAAAPPASPLHVVALREGPIQLMRLGTKAAVVLEGEPLPLVDGVPTRGPSGSRGLPGLGGFDEWITTVAVSGTLDPTGTAWTVTREERERAAPWYRVHRNRNQGQGWEPVDLREGLIAAHHEAYVECGGARFGLLGWSTDPAQDHYSYDDESTPSVAYWRTVRRAQSEARRGFVRLEGPEVPVPELPQDVQSLAAVTTSDGTLYALVDRPEGSETKNELLLVWPPGATKPERVELPEHGGGEPTLDANGDVALVMGAGEDSTSYLVVIRGTQWERVPVSMPGRSTDASSYIVGAGRAASGELWAAAAGSVLEPGDPPVWRKPVDGEWEAVPLPRFGDALFGREPGVAYDLVGYEPNGWYSFERAELDERRVVPTPKALTWADGEVWVVLELGPAYDDEQESPTMRHVLLSTRMGAAAPTRLPAPWELYIERHNALGARGTPGKEGCTRVSLVMSPASLVDTQPELVAAVRDTATDEWSVQHVYVGQLEDAEVLVASADVGSPGEAKALQRALAKATGVTPTLDCRIPSFVRMVPSP